MGKLKINKFLWLFIILNWSFFIYKIILSNFVFQSPSSSSPSSSSFSFSSSSSSSSSTPSVLNGSTESSLLTKEGAVEGFRRMLRNNSKYDNFDNNLRQSIGNFQKAPETSDSEYLVPNIIHYIWYTQKDIPLKFHHLLSILSAHKFMQPSSIFFHTNRPPVGPYWEAVLQLDNLVVNKREPPDNLFGEPLKDPPFYTSYSNVDRVKVLMEMGGIYLDLDVIVTRSFHPLRKLPCVIGREQDTKACGSVIVCSRDSPFLLLWLNSYLDDYQSTEWAYNSGKVPFNLANRYPHLVHMDQNTLNRPNFQELHLIWGAGSFPWWRNYAVHTWYRLWKDRSGLYEGVEPDEDNIKQWNCTFAQMARSILYGSTRLMDYD